MHRTPSYRSILVVFILILLPLIFFIPAWLGGVALVQGDGWVANFPLRFLTGKIIRDGSLPLWNPYIFAGMPLLASIYPGALYPFNWIFAVLSPGVAMQVVVITTYHIALIGAYHYARAIGATRFGALVSATLFTFGGYMVMSMGQTSNIAAAAWLGWILLAIERLSQSRSWLKRVLWVTLGALAIALQFFAGVPQITWYTALVAGAYSIFILITRASRGSFVAGLLLMVLSALLLSAVQLLPLRELQLQTARAAIDYQTFSAYSFPPRQILALVFPFLFGGAAMPPYKLPYSGQWGIFATCGYSGLLGLMLAVTALLRRRSSLTLFWTLIAVGSLVLAFGDYLPLKLNHLLFAIPVNNLFRASFRHMFEFTFAIGVLAGIGVDKIRHTDTTNARRLLRLSMVTIAGLVILSLITSFAFKGIHSISQPETFVPVIFFLLSALAVFGFAKFRNAGWCAVLLVVLLADLCSFGQFLEWRGLTFSANEAIRNDPSPVRFIKSRESDLKSFRILSQSTNIFGPNTDMLIAPNLSIVRGLETVNGYDMLQMARPAEIMGDMTADGVIRRSDSLGTADRSFDLLNVKYLLCEKLIPKGAIELGGVQFTKDTLELGLANDKKVEFEGNGAVADELVIVSALSNSGNVPNGTTVASLKLHTKDGPQINQEIKAGRDSSEWAFDREDVRATVKHERAQIAESWPAVGFDAHRYLGRIRFERSSIDRIEIQHLRSDAQMTISRISLFDSQSGTSTPLISSPLSPERWRKLASFGEVDVYENLRILPRAWFAKRITAIEDSRILSRIQGRDANASFDPWDEALVDSGSLPEAGASTGLTQGTSDGSVVVARYEPNRISLKTKNDNSGFLVLSEVYYPGWTASIDGRRVRVHRTNYVLRGLSVPPGEHDVEFTFRSRSFLQGAYLSGAGVALLLVSLVCSTAFRRNPGRVGVPPEVGTTNLPPGSSLPREPLPVPDQHQVIRDPD